MKFLDTYTYLFILKLSAFQVQERRELAAEAKERGEEKKERKKRTLGESLGGIV